MCPRRVVTTRKDQYRVSSEQCETAGRAADQDAVTCKLQLNTDSLLGLLQGVIRDCQGDGQKP